MPATLQTSEDYIFFDQRVGIPSNLEEKIF
jgi:hypothetical protein